MLVVGRTPASAPDPPVRLSAREKKADGGVGRGPGGPPHAWLCLALLLTSAAGLAQAAVLCEIAKPATVTVAVNTESGRIVSFSGQAVVKLRDYGLKPPTAALGTIGTKNEMTVEFLLRTQEKMP